MHQVGFEPTRSNNHEISAPLKSHSLTNSDTDARSAG